jgi:CRP/FNR family transcriptional regulator
MARLPPTPGFSTSASVPAAADRSVVHLVEALRICGGSCSYPSGAGLFHQGDRASEVFFLEAGVVKLVCSGESGRELIADIRFAGSLIGLSAVIRKQPHPIAATTASACRLMRIPEEQFRALLLEDTELNLSVHQILSEEIISQSARIGEIACLNARQRLENFIWRITQHRNSAPQNESQLQLPLRQWEVAQFLAITPGYLCRLLDELESEEIISRRNGWLIIPINNNLWHRAD